MKLFVEMDFGRGFVLGVAALLMAPAAAAQTALEAKAFDLSQAQKGISPSLGISVMTDPMTIFGFGGQFNVITTIDNSSGGDVTTFQLDGVFDGGCCAFADLMPSTQIVSSTVDGATGPSWTCMSSGFETYSCTPSGGVLPQGTTVFTVSADIGTKGGNDSADLTVTDASLVSNTANTTIFVQGAGNADLALTSAAFNPVNPAPNDPVNVEVTVANQSPSNGSTDFVVELTSPPGSINLPAPFMDSNFDCFSQSPGVLTCDYIGAGLGPGAQVVLTVPSNAPFGGQSFTVDATLRDSGITDNIVGPGPITATGDTSASMDSFASGPVVEPVPYGEPIVYSIDVMNNGPAPARNVFFDLFGSDDLNSGTEMFDSFTGTNWSCTEGGQISPRKRDETKGRISTTFVSCSYGPDLPAGQSAAPLTITILAPTAQGVSQFSADPFATSDNNTNFPSPGTIVTGVAPSADLSMAKNASVSNATVNDQFTYDLVITNNGPQDIDKAEYTITDTLPPEVSYVSNANISYTCMDSGGTVVCNYTDSPAFLVSGGSETITITVQANSPGSTTNSVTVSTMGPTIDPDGSNDSATADVTIAGLADLSMTKTADVSSIDQGFSFTYTLDIANAGPNDPSAFTVTDTLPPEVSYDGFSAQDFSCSEASNVVTCSYTGTGLASGTSTTIDLNVTALGGGQVTNTASVAISAPDSDPNTGNDSDSFDVFINPQADLSLAKSASVSSATVGDRFDWILDVTNNGPNSADSFTVTDTLPSQTSFVSFVAPDFDCTAAGQTVTCTWLQLANRKGSGFLGPMGTSQIVLTVDADTPGSAINSATVSPDGNAPDLDSSNNSATATVTINAPPMTTLVATTSDDPDPVDAGGDFQLSATFTNQGPSVANNLFATFFIDPGVTYNGSTFVKGLPTGWTCFDNTGGGQKGTATLNSVDCLNPGPLAVNQSTTLTLDLTAPTTPGTISTDIEFGADEFGPGTATETTGVGTDVDLSVTKLASQTQVEVGEDFSYSISVTNNTGNASGIVVSDNISSNLRVTGISGQDWGCQQFQTSFQCDYTPGTLAAGQTTSVLRFDVQAVRAAVIDNTARVSSDQNELNPNDNSDTATVTAGNVAAIDLILTKTSVPTTVAAGEAFQYVLTVENEGTSQASGVTITDQLPGGVEFLSAMGSGWSCNDLGGGLVQCVLSSALLPNSEVPPSSVTLNVTAPLLIGDLVNTADVMSEELDIDTTDNRASATTTIIAAGPAADLNIVKSVDRSSARRGDLLTYTIDLVNLGPETATGIRIDDALPVGLQVRDVLASNWDCVVATGSISCDLRSNLGVNENAGLVITGLVTASSGQLTNRVNVSSASFDPVSANNGSSVDTTITGDALPADLGILLSDSADPVLTGDAFNYLITLSNDGPGGAQDYAITGVLPAGIIPGAITAPDLVDCGIEGELLICRSVGIFPPNEFRLITFAVTAPDTAATLSFSVEVQNTGLGVDANPDNNSDTETTTVRITPTAEQLEDRLISALAGIDDPLVTDNLSATANLCADPPPDLVALCRAITDALDDGRGGEVAEAIRQLVGAPALTQHTSLVEASGVQFTNMFSRFTQNRQGNGQTNAGTVNIDGLSFRYGNEILPLSLLDDGSETEIDSSGLVKPWAFFINGTISGGDKDPTTREVGFDFDTLGLTMGVDYRFSTRFIGGVALGYSDFESDIQGGGVLETDGLTLHLFANYYPTDRIYIDGLISFGSMDFEQRRPISFTLGNLVVQEMANGSTESDQLSGALAAGYNFNRGGWNITPSASLSFMDADIDAFVESGTSLGLNYTEQNVESLIISANLNVTKVISLTNGILTPTFDVAYHHESQNDKNGFNSTIIGGPAGAAFLVDADDPDRNYGSAGLGLVFVGANGRQAFLSYRNVLGLSGFSRWTVNAGVRFEF